MGTTSFGSFHLFNSDIIVMGTSESQLCYEHYCIGEAELILYYVMR